MFTANSDRSESRSYKVAEPSKFGKESAVSLGCADFDYDVPKEVSDFVYYRAAHKIYGYTMEPPQLKANIRQYYSVRHSLQIEDEHIMYAPGVLASIGALLYLFSSKYDKILLLEPEYPPFFKIIREFGLQPVTIYLQNGKLDYDLLAEKLKHVQIMLFSNPHNPTGNTFEIKRISELCTQAGVFLISDEIWADFYLYNKTHQSAYDFGFPALLAPSKTFNMPGIPFSVLIWKNESKLQWVRDFCGRMHIGSSGCFYNDAADVAYGKCGYWVDYLLILLKSNFKLVSERLGAFIPIVGGYETCLLFLDFSALFSDSDEARNFFMEHGVYLQSGNAFYYDEHCPGAWLRMNIGSPTSMIESAVNKMVQALSTNSK